jgi:4-diphosphocytidyl-2-C-methyl-D-erythritol kinase
MERAAPGSGAGPAVRVLAPAKVNLTLEILRRRPDGYHDLATVMQAIDLADEVAIELAPGGGIALAVTGAVLPTGAENLAVRAAAAFLAALPATWAGRREPGPGVSIRLTKRIPIAAGLGGGSADAAAVLLGLNQLLGRPLGAAALQRLAAGLGSDVPFFLVGGTCLATGRGELLRRLPPLPPCRVVLVAPGVPVETQWAYRARSAEELTSQGRSSSMLEFAIRERSWPRIARALVNDLEEVVARRYGAVAGVLEELRRGGRVGARMSGSGAAAYGLVAGAAEAQALANSLGRLDHPVHVCRPSRAGCRVLPRGGN